MMQVMILHSLICTVQDLLGFFFFLLELTFSCYKSKTTVVSCGNVLVMSLP